MKHIRTRDSEFSVTVKLYELAGSLTRSCVTKFLNGKSFLFLSSLVLALGINAAFATPERANHVDANKKFQSAETCRGCHTVQYDQWSGSMMAYASLSPVIGALEKTENFHNTDGPVFARTPDSEKINGEENQLACQKCHSPIGVATDMFPDYSEYADNNGDLASALDTRQVLERLNPQNNPMDAEHTPSDLDIPGAGLNYFGDNKPRTRSNIKAALEGVTCVACHRITGPDDTFRGNGFEPGIANNAYMLDGNETVLAANEGGIRNIGPYLPFGSSNPLGFPFLTLDIGNEHQTGFSVLRQEYGQLTDDVSTQNNSQNLFLGEDGIQRPYIQTGEFCGSCHDVRLDGLNGRSPEVGEENVRRLENLFTEWRISPWNNNDNVLNPLGVTDSLIKGGYTYRPDNPREELAVDSSGNPVMDGVNQVKVITTCQDCHMSTYMKDPLAKPGIYDGGDIAFNDGDGIARTDHSFIGVDRALVPFPNTSTQINHREILLQKAVDFRIINTSYNNDGDLAVDLSVTNVGAGHNIPAGFSQERQVWVDIRVTDASGEVFKSGYLVNHKDASWDCEDNNKQWKCDLDDVRPDTQINERLVITNGNGDPYLEPIDPFGSQDTQLVNYQNEFKVNGNRIFNPFMSDETDNSHSLVPFKENIHRYDVDVGSSTGPFTVTAKLRFRPFPHEFLEALADHGSNRITESVMQNNTIIEMASSRCSTGYFQTDPDDSQVTMDICPKAVPRTSTGTDHACSIQNGGALYCWGRNNGGQVGIDSGGVDVALPVQVIAGGVKQVATGKLHTCAIVGDGELYCWGNGGNAQLGDNDSSVHNVYSPRRVDNLDNVKTKFVATGRYHTCAVVDDEANNKEGVIMCWGSGSSGALGNGATTEELTPFEIPGLSGAKSVSLGYRTSCALFDNGDVHCWGYSAYALHGDGVNNNNGNIGGRVFLQYPATQITTGYRHHCAILTSGEVQCWGYGYRGRLGDGSISSATRPYPVFVQGLDGPVVSISAGYDHTCALQIDSQGSTTPTCWGSNSYGQLGNVFYSETSSATAIEVSTAFGIPSAKEVSAGGYFSCLTTHSNELNCWGQGNDGKLSDGDVNSHSSIYLVKSIADQFFDPGFSSPFFLGHLAFGTIPWSVSTNGSTPTSLTGPQEGVDGSNSDVFYYLESTGTSAGDEVIVEFPPFSPVGKKLTFNYHRSGSGLGNLHLDVWHDGAWQLDYKFYSGPSSSSWLSASETFPEFSDMIKIRLRANSVGSSQGDIAIDNIRLSPL